MTMPTHILIVDDDVGIRDLMSSYLARNGFAVDAVSGVAQMREQLKVKPYGLIVLDLMMPDEDGLSALRQLQREGGPRVIMLSAMASDLDRIVGLEVGADDYLAKPCNPRELLARVRTVLRRGAVRPEPVEEETSTQSLYFDDWRLDLDRKQLYEPSGTPVALSGGELRLLCAFVDRPRRILTRDQLLEYVGAADGNAFDRAIDVQVSRLRRKLSVGGGRVELIRTVRNEGYMFLSAVRRSAS